MSKFIRIGDSLINLSYVRAAEFAPDGRLQIFLSEERAAGLVLRYSGEEAREAWEILCDPANVPVIETRRTPHAGNGSSQARTDGQA